MAMITLDRIVTVVGAVIAVLLQVFLAPHIAIGYALPNFIMPFCLVIAVARSQSYGPVLPFVLGLVYDIVSGGPVGAMALMLMVFSALAAWLHNRTGNDTLFMALVVLVVSVLAVELFYGILVLMFGYAAGIFEAFAYRIAPCFAYDAIISLVLYLLIARFYRVEAPLQSEIRQLH